MEYKKLVFGNQIVNQNKCVICGEYFMTSDKEKDTLYCSAECEAKAREIKKELKSEKKLKRVEFRSELSERKWQQRVGNKTRQEVFERDEFICAYCGNRCYEDYITNPRALTVDHLIPRALGGNNDTDNLVTCCMECNVIKGARRFESFEDAREYIIKRKKDTSFINFNSII
jgi:5-methylcytosine-specific restriction endonuclease McrA